MSSAINSQKVTVSDKSASTKKSSMNGSLAGKHLPEGYLPTRNIVTGTRQCPFALPTTYSIGCTNNVCHASIMEKHGMPCGDVDQPIEEIKAEAIEYLTEYYYENKLPDEGRDSRIQSVCDDIERTGHYVHTFDELAFGVKTAWRNSGRCIMRSQWSTIQIIDKRGVQTGEEMLESCFEHLRIVRNGGKIKPTMTVFPQRFPGTAGARIWNPQLIRYAGYVLEDGNIIGDPANVEITRHAIEFGWEPKYGRWDILPVIVHLDGDGEPVWREVPKDTFAEVKISHPSLEWFEELDLRWQDYPHVSCLSVSIGGISYTAAPFTGWYLSTEIASRNLADENRYNALPEIARRMGLPMQNRTLWKDRAVLELNQAVLYSYDKAEVSIIDHHSASESFVTHYEKEVKTRGHCPADWVWVTPPFSSGTTRTFHQEMYNYLIKPAILPCAETAWDVYWRSRGHRPHHARVNPQRVQESSDSRASSIQIAYATETGTAQNYAQKLLRFLRQRGKAVFDQLLELDELDVSALPSILLVVTSTFGEGTPPSGGKQFAERSAVLLDKGGSQSQTRYAVFGLGSSAYIQTYQKYPSFVDKGLARLGARRILPPGRGDDLDSDLSAVFNSWMSMVTVGIEADSEDVSHGTESKAPTDDTGVVPSSPLDHFRTFEDFTLASGYAMFNNRLEGEAHRATYHLVLRKSDGGSIDFSSGDHIAILPVSDVAAASRAAEFLGILAEDGYIFEGIPAETIVHHYIDLAAPPPALLLQMITTPSSPPPRSVFDALLNIDTNVYSRDVILRILPLKTPRYFSVASTPLLRSELVDLTVAQLYQGVVSSTLANSITELSLGRPALELKASIIRSKFHLPPDNSLPLIFIATGTGVGAIRGLLCERSVTSTANKDRDPFLPKHLCYVGFRTPDERLYATESQFSEASADSVVRVAYSRGSDIPRQHVDDLVREDRDLIVKMLDRGGIIFICGSHTMGKAVENALVDVFEGRSGSGPTGRARVTQLKRDGRLISDTYMQGHKSSS